MTLTPPHQQPLRMLCVEDEPLVAQALAHVARQMGFEVTCIHDPTQAFAPIYSGDFQILAVDYSMPGLNGVELMEATRHAEGICYRFMITALPDFEVLYSALNRTSVNRYITKPWQMDELRALLRDAEDHTRLWQENQWLHQQLSAQNRDLSAHNQTLEALAHRRTLDVLTALISALDYRDTETQWHSRRVALFARMMARQLGLDNTDTYHIELGALLHDVGKIAIPDQILHKPGKLTPQEWVLMKQHSAHGHKLLQNIDFLERARVTVLHHHERWDGQGYPQGLYQEEIDLGARIFAICDTLDAITSDRPYRKANTLAFAAEEIARGKGTQFDPVMVAAFDAIGEARWQSAIDLGHLQDHEEFDPEELHQRILCMSKLLPEVHESYAWQSIKNRDDAFPFLV